MMLFKHFANFVVAIVSGNTALSASLSPKFTPYKFVEAARNQVGITTQYDGSYRKLTYPLGDVPMVTGVCSDVVIRALRKFNLDLQKEVSLSIAKYRRRYRPYLTRNHPDRNIDHRRVKVLAQYFALQGWTIEKKHLRSGDIVVVDLGNGQWHIAVVSNRKTVDRKRWLVIHNWGNGAEEEDLFQHYAPLMLFRAPKHTHTSNRMFPSS